MVFGAHNIEHTIEEKDSITNCTRLQLINRRTANEAVNKTH